MSEEEGGYKLKVNPLGLVLPFGSIVFGLALYFLTTMRRLRVIGLLLALMGVGSVLGISFPLLQLFKAKLQLQKQEREVKLDRLEEKVKERSNNQEEQESKNSFSR